MNKSGIQLYDVLEREVHDLFGKNHFLLKRKFSFFSVGAKLYGHWRYSSFLHLLTYV